MRPISYNKADVIAICFSLVDKDSLTNACTKWYREVRQLGPKCPVILVGTKLDLKEQINASGNTQRMEACVQYDEGKAQAKAFNFSGYVECSAANKAHLDKVMYVALESVLKFRGDISRSTSISVQNDVNASGIYLDPNAGKKKKKWSCSVL